MTEPFYVAVKGSLHASDSSVFGLTPEEVNALSKRYPDSNKEVINGVLIKASPLKVINSLCELGYRVVCSSGEAEIVWTLRREILDESTELICGEVNPEIVKQLYSSKNDYISCQSEVENTEKDKENEVTLKRISIDSQLSKKLNLQKQKKEVEKIGTRPEDFAAYSDYTGPKIIVRNPSSLENIEEGTPVIVNTNTPNPQNPLASSYSGYINKFDKNTELKMEHCSHCNLCRPTASAYQTLDEMDFERGIWTPAMTGDIDKVRIHLNKGTNPNVEDNGGYTALHYAARGGYPLVCDMLLRAGALVNKTTRAGGSTALHRAALAGHQDVFRLLMHYGANLVAKDVDGRTPLHRAVEGGHKNIIADIIEAIPSAVNEKDNQGKTPLDYAEERGVLSFLFPNAVNKA